LKLLAGVAASLHPVVEHAGGKTLAEQLLSDDTWQAHCCKSHRNHTDIADAMGIKYYNAAQHGRQDHIQRHMHVLLVCRPENSRCDVQKYKLQSSCQAAAQH
jgi:hypothetical protein